MGKRINNTPNGVGIDCFIHESQNVVMRGVFLFINFNLYRLEVSIDSVVVVVIVDDGMDAFKCLID